VKSDRAPFLYESASRILHGATARVIEALSLSLFLARARALSSAFTARASWKSAFITIALCTQSHQRVSARRLLPASMFAIPDDETAGSFRRCLLLLPDYGGPAR